MPVFVCVASTQSTLLFIMTQVSEPLAATNLSLQELPQAGQRPIFWPQKVPDVVLAIYLPRAYWPNILVAPLSRRSKG